MNREANAPETYEDVIRTLDTPNKTVSHNTMVLTSKKWTTINRKYCIATGLTVTYHQYQNYAEYMGGSFKFSTIKLVHDTP